MRVLLVEDDEFKASDLSKVVIECIIECEIIKAASVTSALRLISSELFNLIILDMSLPTFDLSGPGGGGSPQGQGGIEVIRVARRLNICACIVVVTQYPDIEIDGNDVALSQASKILSSRFSCDVRACIHYEFDGDGWRDQLRNSLLSSTG